MSKITIRNTRLAFPALFEARSVAGEGKPRYSAAFILPADHPQLDEVNAAIEEVAKDKWGAKAGAVLKELRSKDRVALHDGDTKAQYDGFEGNFYVSASNAARPLIADRDRSILVESDGVIYAGCYVYATVEFWAQDNQFGKRINAELKTVQFFRDGDAFTGGGRPGDEEDLVDLSEGIEADLA